MKNFDNAKDVPSKLIELEEELEAVKRQSGIKENSPLWIKIGDWIVDHVREPVTVNRRKYIMLALTCGWFCGAHRFYTKNYFWGTTYLIFSWTGYAFAMTMVDLLILWLKYAPDENGMITI